MLTLVIGNKNYSSWSLRPWLLMRQAGIPFREIRVPLYQEASRAALKQYTPWGRVPVLIDGDRVVWESLAVCEYLAERFADRSLWPSDPGARAVARAVSAEMHAGFAHMRAHLTMNCRQRFAPRPWPPAVEDDIVRIVELWADCRSRFGGEGGWLFGDFSIADAFFAPVACRFTTYAVPLPPAAAAYVDTVMSLPAMRDWMADARTETEVLPQFEADRNADMPAA